ncbi:lipopolysaccharide transport periplasmic protein LptA [Colwellia sp.]|uniref:lipopolysaccharide transport periplasmic protein LptA n=1 Tax=Colwellia sp. TaxID=56799 RepID=UPI0025B7CB97|nr:lipopolysaccharide transport periplasmic protein LptA [Colwellia sp.]
MIKANLNSGTLKVLALTCSLFLFTSAQAAKKDLEQEITIKSQRQSADLKNKIASYLDNVSIQQGSISITADIVKVFSSIDKNSGEKTDTYLAKGNPAVFQQKLEDGSLIKLQADEITYIPNANMITISGNALVKQAGSEVRGNEITYNTLSEKLEAQGSENQSVTTVLQPTILKKQKETYEKSKAEKTSDKVVDKKSEKKGNGSDN